MNQKQIEYKANQTAEVERLKLSCRLCLGV